MPEFGFATSTDFEKGKKSLIEVDTSLLVGTDSVESNGRMSVIRKEIHRKEGVKKKGTRKVKQRLFQDPILDRREGVIRKASWVLLDSTEELKELKPSHHSTPLVPNTTGTSR